MKLMMIAALALTMGAARADEKIGAGVMLNEATPIAELVKSPRDFVGKTVRVDGVATAVCEAMGCWMAVSESEKPGAPTVRFKVEDGGPIVFPMSAKGKKVSAEGKFEAITAADDHGKEAAGEHARHDAKAASAHYQIHATGAVIK